jgi:hypothetical protein
LVSGEVVQNLLKSCPNLEELGIALESIDFSIIHPMMPLCPGLRALRILIRADEPVYDLLTFEYHRFHLEKIARETWMDHFRNLRWMGVGPLCFELGRVVGDGTEARPYRREVKHIPWDDVKHVDIFGMDTLEI